MMQAMSRLDREVKCVANNMEKYMIFSVGGLRFIDNLRGYDAHHLMQAMSRLDREVKCVANNMENT